MNIKTQATLLLILNSVCCFESFSQSDTLKLSKAPIINPNLSIEQRFPDDHGIIETKILWIRKLMDESKSESPVIFNSKVLVANSSKCYDLYSGKPMNLQSDSSKRVFAKSFIQIPFKDGIRLYSQGKLVGSYGGVQSKIAAHSTDRAFGFENYKVMCVDFEGQEIWNIKHPKRMASEVWLRDDFILALESFSFPFKSNDVELIVLDYHGKVRTIVDELEETPGTVIEKAGILYIVSSSELFALDIVNKKVIWRIDKPIEQRFRLHNAKLVSASLVLDPETGTVIEKHPMGTFAEWKRWNDNFVTRVFDGDEYNDFICEGSPRKYYYLSYRDLRSYQPFKSVSLTANYPDETIGDTTAAIIKGNDGFYLVGLKVNFP